MAINPEEFHNPELLKLTPKEFKVFTQFQSLDVTDRANPEQTFLAGIAQSLTADEYTRFHKSYYPDFPNNPKLQIDILEKVTGDKYSNSIHSRLKAAVNTERVFTGSLRFTRGSNDLVPPVESMNLYIPTSGDWPHREGEEKLQDDQIGEFGRIATMYEQRKSGNARAILSSLFEEGFKDAREHGIKQAYIIMPTAEEYSQLHTHVKELGYNPTVVPNVRLRMEDPTVQEITSTFSNYWVVREPKLFTIAIPNSPSQSSPQAA